MSKFNRPDNVTRIDEWPEPDTINKEGAEAYEYSARLNLLTRAMTSLMSENKYYESAKESDEQLIWSFDKILRDDPEYAKGLLLSLRSEFHMRSVTHALVAHLIHQRASEGADIIAEICERPDDMTEILAYYTAKFGDKKLPNALKKGLGRAFGKFNEYQLSKYDRKGKVWLRDILRIAHPKPQDEKQAALWKKVVADELPPADTWENKISNEGSTEENWSEMVMSGKMGYMALMRNLRNLLKHNVPMEVIDKACTILSDPKRVEKSKQLPFRFFSAYRALREASGENPHNGGFGFRGGHGQEATNFNATKLNKLLNALEEAARLAASNVPKLEGTSVIACDSSGSMQSPISDKSSVARYDVGMVMGSMAHRFSDKAITGMFANTWKEIEIDGEHPLTSTWELHRRVGEVGHGTQGFEVMKALVESRKLVDRVMFFTDMQLYGEDCWDGAGMKEYVRRYREEINENLKLYFFDLAGYGSCVIPESDPNTMIVGGWSEKLFDIIPTFEEGGKETDALEQRIRARYEAFKARKEAKKALKAA